MVLRHFLLVFLGIIYLIFEVHSVTLGGSCDRHTSCNYEPDDLIANSKCERGVCVCAYGYYGESGDEQCVKGHLGDGCDTKVNGTAFCQAGDEHSICLGGSCACETGYAPEGSPQPPVCTPVVPGTTCPPGATGDALCQTGILSGYCTASSECSCPSGREVYVAELKACHEELFTDVCTICRTSGGRCYDLDSDGLPDGCECPSYKSSSTSETLAVVCDIGLAEIGQFCSARDLVDCRPDHSQCRPANDLSGRSDCRCEPGFIVHRTSSRFDFRRKSECYSHLSRFTDPNCATCEENNGQCYDVDGDRLRDGCECPDSRSTTDSNDPTKDCDVVHLNIECKGEEMRICYTPHNNTDYYNIADRLSEGSAFIYVRNHHGIDPCMFERVADDWCLTLSLSADRLEACGTKVTSPTQSVMSYDNFIVIQTKNIGRSHHDLNYHVYCQYDTKVHAIASGADITDDNTLKASEGEEIHPVLQFDIYDQFGRDATQVGVGLGHPVFLRVVMSDNKLVYTSIRPELCLASNQPVLSTQDSSTLLLLLDGCPAEADFITLQSTFAWEGDNTKVASTGLFPMFTLNDANNVFFHCAVTVCRERQDCAPRSCASRKRRSHIGEDALERMKRGLVDSNGRLNRNLLENLRTGSVKVGTNRADLGGNSPNSQANDDLGFFESEETVLIVAVVGGMLFLLIVVVIILVCCCGRKKRKRPSRPYAPRMPFPPPWGMNPYQQIPNPYMQMPNPYQQQNPFMQPNPFMPNPLLQQGQNPADSDQTTPIKNQGGGQQPSPTQPSEQTSPNSNAQSLLQLLQAPSLAQQLQNQAMLQQLQTQNALQQIQAQNLLQTQSPLQQLLATALKATPSSQPALSTANTHQERPQKRRHSFIPEHCSSSFRDASFLSISTIQPMLHATQTTCLTGRHIDTLSDFRIPRPKILLPKWVKKDFYF